MVKKANIDSNRGYSIMFFEIINETVQIFLLLMCVLSLILKKIQINMFFVIPLILLIILKLLSVLFRTKNNIKTYNEIEKIKGSLIKDSKYLLREQRHDFMNIYQVVYGYLQLNDSKKALEHIKKSIVTSSGIGKCYYLTIFSISILLDKKIREATNKGLEIVIEVDSYVDSELRGIENEKLILDSISKILDAFISCTNKNYEESKLLIDIYEHEEKIEFVFNGHIDIELLEEKYGYFENITKADDGFEVVFHLNNTKDLITEDSIYSYVMNI
ncbi:MAG: hypothetical protein EWM50_05640 [Gottschalkiaceae bacterium]|nr:MAG: hypothetical protein EWM50_05640 [Gottschalkiaceae bacterium]